MFEVGSARCDSQPDSHPNTDILRAHLETNCVTSVTRPVLDTTAMGGLYPNTAGVCNDTQIRKEIELTSRAHMRESNRT